MELKLKKLTFYFVVVCLIFTFVGVAEASENSFPSLVINPTQAQIDSETEIIIMGAGFTPNTDVRVRTLSGVADLEDERIINDITAKLDNPTTDEHGTFLAVWTMGRSERTLYEGVYPIWVIVEDDKVYSPISYFE